jgi:ligand-binding sensor domain-containing protein
MVKFVPGNIIIILFFLFASCSIFPQVNSQLYLENAIIQSIKEDDDFIWVATYGEGIFRYSKQDDKWSNFSTKKENLENDLFYNLAVSKDYVWAGSGDGLFTYDKKKNQWRKRKFAQGGEMGNWIRSLYFDPSQNILWIGRFKNLTRLEVAKQKFTDYDVTENTDSKTNNIISIKPDGDSLIWFGSESGVHVYNKYSDLTDKNSWSFINNKNGNFNDEGDAVSIHDMLFELKTVWFATDEFVTAQQPKFNMGGIYKFNRKFRWDRISKEDGLSANGIYCLERTGNYIWSGLYSFDRVNKKEYGKGLVFINRLTNKVYQVDLNLLNINTSTILSLYFDGDDLWIGSDKGLVRMKIMNPLASWEGKKEIKPQDSPKKRKKNILP